jgi:hypothetical protein
MGSASEREKRDRLTNTDIMEKITIRVPSEQLQEFDRLVEEGAYPNRSEAIRDNLTTPHLSPQDDT